MVEYIVSLPANLDGSSPWLGKREATPRLPGREKGGDCGELMASGTIRKAEQGSQGRPPEEVTPGTLLTGVWPRRDSR